MFATREKEGNTVSNVTFTIITKLILGVFVLIHQIQQHTRYLELKRQVLSYQQQSSEEVTLLRTS